MELVDKELRSKWENEQKIIASKISIYPDKDLNSFDLPVSDEDRLFGGVDISFANTPKDDSSACSAVAVYVVTKGKSKVVYQDSIFVQINVPYVPSFLAFREIDAYETLIKKQLELYPQFTPCMILVDGNGIWHPRGAGIACFIGVKTGIPTIGVSKTFYNLNGLTEKFVKSHIDARVQNFICTRSTRSPFLSQKPYIVYDKNALKPGDILSGDILSGDILSITGTKSSFNSYDFFSDICKGYALLLESNPNPQETCGAALVGHGGDKMVNKTMHIRTKRPIFISVGHQVSLQQAVQVCASLSKSRIPEPIRIADSLGRQLIKKSEEAKCIKQK